MLPRSMAELLQALDAYGSRIPLDRLAAHLEATSLCFEDVKAQAVFGDRTYRRNLLHTGPAYQALILCWKNGQRSPIHDHRGSSCGVRVLRGEHRGEGDGQEDRDQDETAVHGSSSRAAAIRCRRRGSSRRWGR